METISSVISQSSYSEIIVIDNASEDNSVTLIRTNFPEIRIIRLNKNKGPAEARNRGFNAASSDIILFLDNDISLADDFFTNLLCELQVNGCPAAIMPQVFFASRRNSVQYNGASCHFLGHMILEGANKNFSEASAEASRKIDSIVTACFVVNRKILETDTPFDASFFFNYEDHDFGLRTRLKGLEIVSLSTLRCFHKEGTAGLSRREGWKYSKKRVYYLIRNRWQIIIKNYQLRTIILLFPMFVIYELFQLAAVIKKHWLTEWIKASAWILYNIPDILRKRSAVQKSRRIDDRDILRGGPIPFFRDLPQNRLENIAKNFLDYLSDLYWKRIKTVI